MTTPLTEPVHIGDLLKYETPMRFCREKKTLHASVQSIEVGSPLDATGKLLGGADVANVKALALEAIEATGSEEIMALVRGPAIIDKDRLHLESGVTWAALEPYLEKLGILGRSEPVEYTEGTDAV